MSIEVSINGKQIVNVKATWNSNSKTGESFHDLARLAHHALDKGIQQLQTVKVIVNESH